MYVYDIQTAILRRRRRIWRRRRRRREKRTRNKRRRRKCKNLERTRGEMRIKIRTRRN